MIRPVSLQLRSKSKPYSLLTPYPLNREPFVAPVVTPGPPPFVPTDIPNLDFWMDANNAASIVATPGSFSWTNLGAAGGVGFNNTTATPRTGVNTMNGKNVVNFGVNANLTWTGALNPTEKTVFVVTKVLTNMPTTNPLLNYFGNPAGYALATAIYYDSGRNQYAYLLVGSGIDVFVGGYTSTSPNIPTRFVFRNDLTTTANFVTVNDVSLPLSWNNPSYYVTSPLSYGMGDALYPNTFDLAEMLIYDRSLSDVEVAEVNAYLTDKWGV